MLPEELIKTRLSLILKRLGVECVCNAALYKEEIEKHNLTAETPIVLPTEEEILAENDVYLQEVQAELATKQLAKTKEQMHANWLAQGYDTKLGYKLRVGDTDQSKFLALAFGETFEGTADDKILNIESMEKQMIAISWGELRPILIAYKNYCKSAWEASKGINPS